MMIGMPPSITNSPAVVRNIIQSILVAIIVKENVHNRKKFVTKGSLFFLPLFEKNLLLVWIFLLGILLEYNVVNQTIYVIYRLYGGAVTVLTVYDCIGHYQNCFFVRVSAKQRTRKRTKSNFDHEEYSRVPDKQLPVVIYPLPCIPLAINLANFAINLATVKIFLI